MPGLFILLTICILLLILTLHFVTFINVDKKTDTLVTYSYFATVAILSFIYTIACYKSFQQEPEVYEVHPKMVDNVAITICDGKPINLNKIFDKNITEDDAVRIKKYPMFIYFIYPMYPTTYEYELIE